jgi:hypothetical protein
MDFDKFIEIALRPTRAYGVKDWYFCLLDENHQEVKYEGYARVPFTRWDTPAMRIKKTKKKRAIKIVNTHQIDFGTCKSTPKACRVKYIGIGCNLGIMFEADLAQSILVSSYMEFSVAKGDLKIEDDCYD